ncbi:MAG: hypothetical protein HYV62_07500 [Candidatus Rokubacteria bacterium]|nr:hypothetical protein [Candidatus Rokubacteria bacterium]
MKFPKLGDLEPVPIREPLDKPTREHPVPLMWHRQWRAPRELLDEASGAMRAGPPRQLGDDYRADADEER